MGKIWNAVDRQVIRPRVYAAEAEGIASTFEAIGSFYGQGNPVYIKEQVIMVVVHTLLVFKVEVENMIIQLV